MENILTKIERNTSVETVAYLVCSGKGADVRTNFKQPIILDQNYKHSIALTAYTSYFSIPNVESSINGRLNIFDPHISKWTVLTFESGSYSLNDLNDCLQSFLPSRGIITIKPDFITLKAKINIAKGGYQVKFDSSTGDLSNLLGFNNKIISAGLHVGDNIVNILSVNSISVSIDIIAGGFVDGVQKNIIHSFFPSVGVGEKIIERPVNLIYLPIIVNRIENLRIRLLDQSCNLLNFRDEVITCQFIIKRC